jgi:hypothetical protein
VVSISFAPARARAERLVVYGACQVPPGEFRNTARLPSMPSPRKTSKQPLPKWLPPPSTWAS